jgi:hypothetical protein
MAQPRFQLIPGSRLSSSPVGGVGWRLLGPNNRELGRGAVSYLDAQSAHTAIERIRDVALAGEVHIVHDPHSGLWAWHLDDGGLRVATSGRGFRHERECRYNLEQFREAAPTAPSSDQEAPVDGPWQRSSAVATPGEATP